MPKQNSIIVACFIISVLLSGCGIKGPLTQKPVQEKTQKSADNTKKTSKTEQNQSSVTQQEK